MAIQQQRQGQQNDPYYQEEPDWMEYLERKSPGAINREEGVFGQERDSSINTARSVFEKGVIFSTGNKSLEDRRNEPV